MAQQSIICTINQPEQNPPQFGILENGLMLSTDHGVTWGVDTNGNMLVNVTAKGINADWIVD